MKTSTLIGTAGAVGLFAIAYYLYTKRQALATPAGGAAIAKNVASVPVRSVSPPSNTLTSLLGLIIPSASSAIQSAAYGGATGAKQAVSDPLYGTGAYIRAPQIQGVDFNAVPDINYPITGVNFNSVPDINYPASSSGPVMSGGLNDFLPEAPAGTDFFA